MTVILPTEVISEIKELSTSAGDSLLKWVDYEFELFLKLGHFVRFDVFLDRSFCIHCSIGVYSVCQKVNFGNINLDA